MRILSLCSAFNGLSRHPRRDLRAAGRHRRAGFAEMSADVAACLITVPTDTEESR